jgi:hypothetical protein
VEAMPAMALLPICDSSFTCEDYNEFMALSWCPFPLRQAHPGPNLHIAEPSTLTSLEWFFLGQRFRAPLQELGLFLRVGAIDEAHNLV